MAQTLSQLCSALTAYGMKPTLEGDSAREIRHVATLDDAQEGDITFLSNPKYEKKLETTRATAVVLRPGAAAPVGLNLIRCEDPYAAITVLIVALHGYRKHPPPSPSAQLSVSPSARIGPNATLHHGVTISEDVTIGANAVIYPGCAIGPRCRIGDDVTLFPNVVIYEDTVIGNRVTIHAGTVIGEDGLGYAPVNGRWVKIPQIGYVEIGDDVEIGSNCSIDRATLGKTVIAAGTKFSNLIAIGHGTHIGEHCLFVAQVGLAGSVSVGDHVTMAGQVGVVGHISIGAGATIGAKAGVINNVQEGETVLGAPAAPITVTKRRIAAISRLPEMRQRLSAQQEMLIAQERRIKALEAKLAQLCEGVPEERAEIENS